MVTEPSPLHSSEGVRSYNVSDQPYSNCYYFLRNNNICVSGLAIEVAASYYCCIGASSSLPFLLSCGPTEISGPAFIRARVTFGNNNIQPIYVGDGTRKVRKYKWFLSGCMYTRWSLCYRRVHCRVRGLPDPDFITAQIIPGRHTICLQYFMLQIYMIRRHATKHGTLGCASCVPSRLPNHD